MLSNYLILCHPLLFLPSIFSSIMVFSSESALCIRWPKNWSFSFSISPSIPECVLLSCHLLEGQLSSWSTCNSVLRNNKDEDMGVVIGKKGQWRDWFVGSRWCLGEEMPIRENVHQTLRGQGGAGPCDIIALMDVGLSRTLLHKKKSTIHFIVVLELTWLRAS